MIITKKLFLLMFLLISTTVMAQSDKDVSTVHMNNGEVYKGKLIKYDQGQFLILERLNGNIDTIPDNEIAKIVQASSNIRKAERRNDWKNQPPVEKKSAPKKKRPYKFRENGWYNVTSFYGYSGRSDNYIKMGIGMSTVGGFQLTRNFGVGLGIGKDNYSSRQGEGLYPVFLETRGYLVKNNNAPFYVMRIGYGIAFTSEKFGITQAEGGLMVNPAFGYRLGGDKTGNIFFEIGYKYQEQFIERKSTFNSDVTVIDVKYHRLSISAGIIF